MLLRRRDQTEEWRGWMQVMFVWYHYFAAKEWYNWIRVYIACYVWMTGFGNIQSLFFFNFLTSAISHFTATVNSSICRRGLLINWNFRKSFSCCERSY